jgi:hypothetical protein
VTFIKAKQLGGDYVLLNLDNVSVIRKQRAMVARLFMAGGEVLSIEDPPYTQLERIIRRHNSDPDLMRSAAEKEAMALSEMEARGMDI